MKEQKETINLNLPFILIMAGGVGSRFWPASREDHPKQFLDIIGTGRSLIQMTFDRFTKWVPASNIYVITNEKYKNLVAEHLPELSDNQIIGEPSRNNTAPCVAYASMKLHKLNPDAVCIVAPADHVILKEAAFLKLIQKASTFASNNKALVTLGISPTRPDTGYGYIDFDRQNELENGIFKVNAFKEKPTLNVAEKYLSAGHYVWNSGMFIWSLNEILDAFKEHATEIYRILDAGREVYNTPEEMVFIASEYPRTESISIDYAILERANKVFTIPADIGWSDLGTWGSLFEKIASSKEENVELGDHLVLDHCKGCIIKSIEGKLLVAKGLENYIVIQDEKSVLIYPKDQEQEIKQVTRMIKENGLEEFL
jgi:mannose-1-phosphate guanylyltransferase